MKPMHMNRLGGLGSFGSLAAVAMVVAMLGGCAPQTLRLGPSVRLPSGAPMSECERQEWLEAAPARVQITTSEPVATVGNYQYYQMHTAQGAGLAVYPVGEERPLFLEDSAPRLGEPMVDQYALQLEPIHRRNRIAGRLMWSGLGMALGGLGVLWIEPITGGSLTLVGLILELVALAVMPPAASNAYYQVRRRVFTQEIPHQAVLRGVERANQTTRRRCSGQVAPTAW